MPSFDIESKVDQHELTNAIDQANRVIGNRFDFKGTDSEILQNENKITLKSQQSFQSVPEPPQVFDAQSRPLLFVFVILQLCLLQDTNSSTKP